ncbi:MAG: DMT family transporter [Ignavibacteria bacterium]|nr:DMT family transporter [Ignavibacteria bacterium]MBI3766825.1 DMT family transporter [Ignavibacteriales bacterium]
MSKQRRAELLLLSITLVWGSTFVITKSVLDENSPLFYTSLRFFLSAAVLFAFFPKRLIRIPRSAITSGSVLGVFLYIGFAFQTVGLQYTTASKSAFFTGMLVVLTPIVHFIAQHFLKLQKKALKVGNIIGVICAATGLYLLTSPSDGGFNIGDGLTLICALMFAFYIVYLDFVSDEPDKMQLTFVMFLVCAVLGMACALLFEHIDAHYTAQYITSLLYLTIFATVIAMGVQNRYQGDTTPTRAAVIFAMEPVIAGIFAYVVRGEIIGIGGMIGGGAIIAGLLLSEFSDEIPGLKRNVIQEITSSH